MKRVLVGLLCFLLFATPLTTVRALAADPMVIDMTVEWDGRIESLSWSDFTPKLDPDKIIVTAYYDNGTSEELPYETGGSDWTYYAYSDHINFHMGGKKGYFNVDFPLPENYVEIFFEEHPDEISDVKLNEKITLKKGGTRYLRFTPAKTDVYGIKGIWGDGTIYSIEAQRYKNAGEVANFIRYETQWWDTLQAGNTYYFLLHAGKDKDATYTITRNPHPVIDAIIHFCYETPVGGALFMVFLYPHEVAFNGTMLVVGMSFGAALPIAPLLYLGAWIFGTVFGIYSLFQPRNPKEQSSKLSSKIKFN